MASAEFLEEALNTNVDESAVNAIVGSLENQLVTSSSNRVVNPGNLNKVLSNGNLVTVQQAVSQASCISEPNKIISSGGFVPNSPHIVTSNVAVNQMPGRGTTYVNQMGAPGNLTLVQKQEPVKIISYPQQGQNVNNRVIYPAQTPNRTIALAPFSQNVMQAGSQGNIVTQQVGKPVQIQSPLILKQGGNNPVGIRPNIVTVPMSNAMGTTIPVDMGNKNQNIVTTQTIVNPHGAMPANVQILNVRPGTPIVQKSVAAVSPRVVMGSPQLMTTRPAGPGITLQTIQSFQPGHQGHLLLKTENGQYQLLRVGPPTQPGATNAHQGQAIRLATVSAPIVSSSGMTMVGNISNSPSHVQQSTVGGATGIVSTQHQQLQPSVTQQMVQQARPANQQFAAAGTPLPQKTSVDNLKEKCRKFLSNLLDLSSKEPKAVERNVRILIQELIDMRVEPEAFCARLEKLLDASPQPCLIGFLKKTLPILRQSLVNKELVIEGIHPPPANLVFSNVSTPTSPIVLNTQSTNQTIPPLQAQLRPAPQQVHQTMPAPMAVNAGKVSIPFRGVSKPQTPHTNKTFIKLTPNLPSSSGPSAVHKQFGASKDKKAAVTTFSQQSFTDIDKMAGDDDINDVAAMGGVNLAEESQKILRSTEMIGTQIRSCKDEYLASMGPLQLRLKQIAAKHGLEEPTFDVAALISHALQERLKNLVEKLACTAEHRLDVIKLNPNYEVTQDVKGQLKFLEDLDRVERKRREDYEREILLRAAKSRSKSEDPEQVKLKEKAKEMQRAEMEEMRQREANLTALQAIGPRKKPRISLGQTDPMVSTDFAAADVAASSKNGVGRNTVPMRARMKRVNYRDLLFLLEQEKDTVRSHLLYKCYLK